MNYNIEELGATKRKLSVEVPEETVRKEMNKTIKELSKQAKIPGFRPGKVPASIIKRMFKQYIEQDLSQKLLEEALPEALKEFQDDMVSQPSLEDSNFEDGKPFTFTVSFEVRPPIEVTGYESLALTREIVKITDEMVDERIESMRQAHATTKSIEEDRPLEAGDLAVVDYEAFDGDEAVEGGANPNYQLEVGSGRFNKDYEDALIGMAKDEQKDIEVKFEDDHYNPKLAGKDVLFKTRLVDIKTKILPDLNDEFVKDLGDELETVDQLKEKIREDITTAEKDRVKRQLEDQAKEKLLELVEFEIPENLVDQEVESMISNMKFNLQRSGLTPEAMGLSEAKMREDYLPEAEKRVKAALILDQIAKDKEIQVEDSDVDDRILAVSRDTGQPPDAIREIYIKNNMLDSLKESISSEKTLKFIIDSATIEDTEPSAESTEETA